MRKHRRIRKPMMGGHVALHVALHAEGFKKKVAIPP